MGREKHEGKAIFDNFSGELFGALIGEVACVGTAMLISTSARLPCAERRLGCQGLGWQFWHNGLTRGWVGRGELGCRLFCLAREIVKRCNYRPTSTVR